MFGFGPRAHERVLGFLDIAGTWDPTLVFVLAGAVVTATIGFRLIGRGDSWFGGPMRLPQRSDIDRPLLFGAALFGAGWGLAGYCPGPGLAALVQGAVDPVLFVAGLVLGMVVFARVSRRASRGTG